MNAPRRKLFLLFFFSGSAAFHGCLPKKRILSLTQCLFLRPGTITQCRREGDGFVLLFYCFWFGEFKTSEGCTKKRHKGTLRQNLFCPEVPLAPFFKALPRFLNPPNPLHPHFHLPSPALQTDGCPVGNIHQEKNLLPWSLPEKRWTPDTEKSKKVYTLRRCVQCERRRLLWYVGKLCVTMSHAQMSLIWLLGACSHKVIFKRRCIRRTPRQWASLSCEPVGMAKARENWNFTQTIPIP